MAESLSIELPNFVKNSLKCAVCSNFLSIAPVAYHDTGLICGRCVPKLSPTFTRATAYETLAQLFTFPCINADQGCKEQLKWNSAQQHESTCKYRLLRCPVVPLGSCFWNGSKDQLLGHFATTHKELTMNLSSYFYLPYKHNVEVNKLVAYKTSFLLFQMRSDVQLGKCWLGLSSINDPDQENIASSYSIELKAAEHSNSMVLQKNIVFDMTASWTMDATNMYAVDINTIKTFLDSNNILCKLDIASNQNVQGKESAGSSTIKIDESMLKELECLVCFEYMVPPIYLCAGGHSVCGICRHTKNVLKCPVCQSPVTTTRNFALENVTGAAKYPCKNKAMGCKFVGNSSSIRNHEKRCVTSYVECPFSCAWKGNTSTLLEHAQKSHNINTTWSLTDTLFRNLRSSVLVDYNLVKFDKKLFKVAFKHSSITGPVHWAVQEVGRQFTDKPEYNYTLKFMDQSNMGRQLIINNLCYGVSGAADFHNCLIIPYQLLKPFVDDEDKLIFQLSIQKI